MAGIKGKNTRPELVLRREMHSRGFRYRLHVKSIAGLPDLVFPKYHAAIFIHGCFWHRHEGCRYTTTPSTRPQFWKEKFKRNIRRDETVRAQLLESGWRVVTIWECALRNPLQVKSAADLLTAWLESRTAELEIGETDLEIQQ